VISELNTLDASLKELSKAFKRRVTELIAFSNINQYRSDIEMKGCNYEFRIVISRKQIGFYL